jgi:hypothetical protein
MQKKLLKKQVSFLILFCVISQAYLIDFGNGNLATAKENSFSGRDNLADGLYNNFKGTNNFAPGVL